MTDEEQILRTLSEYSLRCDDGRFDELVALFTEDAALVFGDTAHRGRPAIHAYLADVQGDGRRGKHLTANSVVEVDGDAATAVTDYLFVRPTPDGLAMVAAGRYLDDLVHDGGVWRFRRRTITLLTGPDAAGDG